MPTFDGENLIVTLDAPTGGVLVLDVEADLYSDWKEWVKLSDNSKYPPLFRPDGGSPLTAGIEQGAYFFIRNDLGWRLRPNESDHTVLVIGSLAPENSTLPVAEPTIGGYTVLLLGLQPITQKVDALLEIQQEALYNGAVHLDTINGTAGTTFPVGTASEPVSNLADAITLLTQLGLTQLFVRGNITLTQAFSDFRFVGLGSASTIDVNGQDIGACTFIDIGLTGNFGNAVGDPILFRGVRFNAGCTNVTGLAFDSVLSEGITLGTGFFAFSNGNTSKAGITDIEIDFNSNVCSAIFRNVTGGFSIKNLAHPASSFTCDIRAGRIDLQSTCSSGAATLAGACALTDASTGTAVNTNGLFQIPVTNAQTGIIPALL